MDRENFIYELSKELAVLPRIEVKQAIQYYQEYFDDSIENGKNEFEIITSLGTPSFVAAQIIQSSNTKEHNRKTIFAQAQKEPTIKNYKKTVAAVISAPVVLPLKLVMYVLGFVFLVVGFSLIVSFGAISFSTFVVGVVVMLGSIPGAIYFGAFILLIELLSAGLILAGVGMLFYLLTKGTFKCCIKTFSFVFSRLVRREQK